MGGAQGAGSGIAGWWEADAPVLEKAHHAEEPGRHMMTGVGSLHLLEGMGYRDGVGG